MERWWAELEVSSISTLPLASFSFLFTSYIISLFGGRLPVMWDILAAACIPKIWHLMWLSSIKEESNLVEIQNESPTQWCLTSRTQHLAEASSSTCCLSVPAVSFLVFFLLVHSFKHPFTPSSIPFKPCSVPSVGVSWCKRQDLPQHQVC